MLALVDLHQKILKPFDKFAVRVLSSLKHSAAPRVLNLIKHCCSFIKKYIKIIAWLARKILLEEEQLALCIIQTAEVKNVDNKNN